MAIQPECVITQSKVTAIDLNNAGIRSKALPLGVDDIKFSEQDRKRKELLRKQYGLDAKKTILIHVGHIRRSRNLEYLSQIKKRLPAIEIVLIGSTYNNQQDKEVYETLKNEGIVIFKDYVPDIENLYNLADYYIFPVIKKDAAIETPLSVLEAMACNLRVITTPFGSLPEIFNEDECFHYIDTVEETIKILHADRNISCNNREKVKLFTWDQVTSRLLELIE